MKKFKQLVEQYKKMDVPAYLRKQKCEKPLTMADVKAPRKDSISAKENLAKARNEEVEQIDEKNVPTSPEKWAQAKSQAKAKFDVYPSAYANGWAAKKYKAMGGGWKSVSEESQVDEGAVPAKEKTVTVRHKISGKELVVTAQKAKEYKQHGYHPVKEGKEVGDEQINDGTPEGLVKKGGKSMIVKPLTQEAKDVNEYDQEGDMAKSDLRSIMANAKRVHDMLEDNDNLPEWVQSKITKAEDYMSTVANYLNAEMNEEVESIDEISQDLAAKYLEKVTHDQLKKIGMKPNMYSRLEPKRQKGVDRALDRLTVKEGTKPPFDQPYTTVKKVVTDKSGAKHSPMSRARDIARKAMQKQVEGMKKMPVKEETRKASIVKKVMKKKTRSEDAFQKDPELSTTISKI